jgi:hypothetical protein
MRALSKATLGSSSNTNMSAMMVMSDESSLITAACAYRCSSRRNC